MLLVANPVSCNWPNTTQRLPKTFTCNLLMQLELYCVVCVNQAHNSPTLSYTSCVLWNPSQNHNKNCNVYTGHKPLQWKHDFSRPSCLTGQPAFQSRSNSRPFNIYKWRPLMLQISKYTVKSDIYYWPNIWF
jgi:hypothetical protein